MACSTVRAVLARLGSTAVAARAADPPNRYCRRHPGELIHVDVKSSAVRPARQGRARTDGERQPSRRWDTATSRSTTRPLAYVEILDDEKARPAPRSCGERSPGSPPTPSLSTSHDRQRRGLLLQRSRPRAPACTSDTSAPSPTVLATNGKAERFIQTLRANGPTPSPTRLPPRRRALLPWLDYYNNDDHTQPSATSRPSAASTDERHWDLQLGAASQDHGAALLRAVAGCVLRPRGGA